MNYEKRILASNKNYKITHHINSSNASKIVIAFGEIDSGMVEIGFGSKLIMENGFDYIYVAQKRGTQYQFLSAEKFRTIVSHAIKGKDVYTYGSSLGGYCAIYYGGIINANILAMSPRIPAHPVIHQLMGERFRNKGFKHKDLNEEVKTRNNHLLDCGMDGAMRTLDLLDQVGLSHVGSYRHIEEKERLPIYNINGLKVAILAYTMRSNGYHSEFFLKNENKHLTSILVSPNSVHFKKVKSDIRNDFERVKKANPDCIIVLPHMGTQFLHAPDTMQKTWCNFFVDVGADLILNDHPHAVQPYEWRKKSGENSHVLIVHCPGNFVNSYIQKNGDASALTQIFLDRKTGKPFALACVPLWAQSPLDGNYRSLPIYDVVCNKEIRKMVSTYEFLRVKEIHELITEVMLGEKLPIDHKKILSWDLLFLLN